MVIKKSAAAIENARDFPASGCSYLSQLLKEADENNGFIIKQTEGSPPFHRSAQLTFHLQPLSPVTLQKTQATESLPPVWLGSDSKRIGLLAFQQKGKHVRPTESFARLVVHFVRAGFEKIRVFTELVKSGSLCSGKTQSVKITVLCNKLYLSLATY